jgi:hypothetical protein
MKALLANFLYICLVVAMLLLWGWPVQWLFSAINYVAVKYGMAGVPDIEYLEGVGIAAASLVLVSMLHIFHLSNGQKKINNELKNLKNQKK